jgi:hypothetical protein
MCQELSEISMIDAFGKRPFPCQKAIITHLNLIRLLTPPLASHHCLPSCVLSPVEESQLHLIMLLLERATFPEVYFNLGWWMAPQ